MKGKVFISVTVSPINAKTTGTNASEQNSNAIVGIMAAFPALISNIYYITNSV